MATMPIHGKKYLQIFLLQKQENLETLGFEVYQVCSDDDLRMIFDLLVAFLL